MLDWLVGYRKDWLRPDIVARLITAAVVLPKAMACGRRAGLERRVRRGVHRSQDAGGGRGTHERARHLGVARGP